MAGFLASTPYILLISVTDINVVSAVRLAGEAGPIEHYASARAINGRAGLYPSRYQNDEVDHADSSLVWRCNRKLRGAAMLGTPGMGVILSGESPVYETGSLKEVNIPNDRSDRQSTR